MSQALNTKTTGMVSKMRTLLSESSSWAVYYLNREKTKVQILCKKRKVAGLRPYIEYAGLLQNGRLVYEGKMPVPAFVQNWITQALVVRGFRVR